MRNRDNRFFLAVLIGCLVAWIGGGILTAQVPPPITRSVLTTNIPAFGAAGQSLHRTTASPYLAWSNNYFIPITNGTGYGTTFVNQTNTTAIYFATNFTVATLPTPPAGYYAQTYAIDAITSQGVGGYVRWDGSNWRTWENVVATALWTNFIFNSWRVPLNAQTPSKYISCQHERSASSLGILPIITGTSGTGSYAGYGGTSTNGAFFEILTGTDTNGTARTYGLRVPCNSSTMTNATGAIVAVQAASTDTQMYWCWVGMDSGSASVYPTTGCGFLYDPYNTTGHGQAGSITNNWICVTANSSSYTYADSGLAPIVYGTGLQGLHVIWTTNAVYFFTNSVLCLEQASNVPVSTGIYLQRSIMQKIAGATSRSLYTFNHSIFREHGPFVVP